MKNERLSNVQWSVYSKPLSRGRQ